jgi:hypothetical protein
MRKNSRKYTILVKGAYTLIFQESDSWNGVLEQIDVVPAITTTTATTIQFRHLHTVN